MFSIYDDPPPPVPTAPGTRPGLGLPLNHHDIYYKNHFPSALSGYDIRGYRSTMPLLTVREITMLRIMEQITNKLDWNIKVFNEDIIAKWSFEIISNNELDVSPKMLEYIIAELRHKATQLKDKSYFTAYDFTTISDHALSEDFRKEFIEAVKVLEDVPDRLKDWHPGSDDKVLDLVHPSLFPLVYGKTRALKPGETISLSEAVSCCGKGDVVPVPSEEDAKDLNGPKYVYAEDKDVYSRKFQWLPCEVDISGDGSKITSYINNLHPLTHKPLYKLIERIIDASIPLWDSTLSAALSANSHYNPRLDFSGDYGMVDIDSVVLPEPGDFTPREECKIKALTEKYTSSGLQVIVKLANIELTPEKPEYGGGSWHLEGQLNEHICATSIYYYSNENITSSTLSFRQQVDGYQVEEMQYDQDFQGWLPLVFGVSVGDAGIQTLGGVSTPQNRLLTFPNVLQHQVQPFKLADPTKNGHRKIVALFLVDPAIKIISTANVPCQRVDWWKEEVGRVSTTRTEFDRLPVEIQEEVFKKVEGFPITLDEAKELRMELMEERKSFEVHQNRAFHSYEFSLCEH